jgi:hypothetical protein
MDHIKDYGPPYTNSKFLICGTTRTTQKAFIISQLNKPNIQQWKIVLQFNHGDDKKTTVTFYLELVKLLIYLPLTSHDA